MQMEREGRDKSIHSGSLFDGFGGFGSRRSMMSTIFGGRDPFDDRFFTRPFGSVFGSNIFDSHGSSDNLPRASSLKGPVIEELDTDDEVEQGEEGNNSGSGVQDDKAWKSARSGKDPIVEHPDDQEEKSKEVCHRSACNRVEETKPQTRSVNFRRVTYGGIDGSYYTATTTRKTGSDGVVLEESKQADKTTGQATHRISRGINDKGHSVTRKLNTDGKVDTMQTLHNLNEDELAGFEQAWKGNAERHLPRWSEELSSRGRVGTSGIQSHGLSLPFADHTGRAGGSRHENGARTSSSGGRPKKVVTINID